jgi:serine/threonine-protein kinase
MGEVYRARDTKLGRDVALKILPEAFTKDPERVARFRREAQLLASLNHPHIGAIYGLEEAPSTSSGQATAQFLVLELVEGETLAAKLQPPATSHQPPRGLALDEALAIARQIADALEAAHEKGIVHRDLKPANIALTADGQVKVLDFGLAKSVGEGSRSGAQGDLSPTLTFAATQAGVILGTAAYMSPEQAKGRAADKRTDVWAFGCVLFEMLTGRRAFEGEDVTDIIAAVVRGEPDWTALPRDVPEQIRLLLKRCLEKDRRTRVSDIGVAKFLMTETIAAPAAANADAGSKGPGLQPQHSRRRFVVGASAGLTAGVTITAIAAWAIINARPVTPTRPVRFTLTPASQPLSLQGIYRHVALSPDGSHIVYQTGSTGPTQLFAVRALNELDSRPLSGTLGREPFMSPDGQWIGYFTLSELRKVSITGGPPITICKTPTAAARGASWGADGTIVFSVADPRSGLLSVPAGGGEPKVLTTAEPGKSEVGHVFPFMLPGDKAVLFTIATFPPENSQIAVLDLKTGQHKIVLRGGTDAKYVESGHLVYASLGTLRAVRFDLARLEVIGDPVPVIDQIQTESTGEANFAVSRQGTLVYVPGGLTSVSLQARSLWWVNRQGREEPIKAPPRPYAIPRLSPDGTRVALDVRDQNSDIWIWDLARQTLTPLTLDPNLDMSPVWTPDGKRIIWASTRGGGNPNLFWQAADGTGVPERLTTNVSAQFPTSVSSDGTRVALFGGATGSNLDISTVTLGGSATPSLRAAPLIESTATKFNPEISPDGRWIAYESNEPGQFQVYVRPFPKINDGRWQISADGGTRPAWAHNGKELFYLDANDLLTSVRVQSTTTTFTPGTPARILSTRYYAGSTSRGYNLRGYDVSPDGQRFLMVKDAAQNEPASTAAPASMVVVLNWFEELKQKVR